MCSNTEAAQSSRTIRSDEETQEASGDHLLYELQMFCASILAVPIPAINSNRFLRCAAIESFCIHTRNLVGFFLPHNWRDTDVIACDYFDNATVWRAYTEDVWKKHCAKLKRLIERIDWEVAHLTYNRNDVEGSAWDWHAEMEQTGLFVGELLVHFLSTCDQTRLGSKFKDRVVLNPSKPVLLYLQAGDELPGYTWHL